MRDLGTAGEKYFGVMCAAAGMAANKSETDINGWDLFVEIDNDPASFDRMSMHEGLIETKIQVKSTDNNKRSVDIELSNLKKIATSSLPCFYVLLEFDKGDTPTAAYLRHFDNDLIEKTLKRISDEHVKDPKVKLNKKKMRLHFDEPVIPFSASTLKQMIISHIGPSHLDYLDRKREHLKSVGFEKGSHRITFSVSGDEKLQQLIDISLGKKGAVEVVDLHGSSLRFGVISDRVELANDSAILTMPDVIPNDQGNITFRDKTTGRSLRFSVDLYSSPFDSWIPKHQRRIRMDGKYFEFHVLNHGKSFNITINFHLLEQFEVEEALKMFKLTHMLSEPKNVDLTFNFQGITSSAYLKSGGGFPDQSENVEIYEKIIKIKNHFEVDTPLHFSAQQIEQTGTKIHKILTALEGAPEVFALKFESANTIEAGAETECFHIISLQIGNYVFLELDLFFGPIKKDDDEKYSMTPKSRKTLYKTSFSTNNFDKKTLKKEVLNLVASYKSEYPVIDFASNFFANVEN